MVLNFGAFHKYYAYLTILCTQAVLFSGFLVYTNVNDGAYASLHLTLAIVNVISFFALLLVCELCHQKFIRGPAVEFSLPERVMTREQFEKSVFEGGEKYVILDDMVLDVKDFIFKHPGGRFVVQHNIGRDISKFFYGGYAL